MCSGDLSDSGVKPTSLTFPALAGGFFTTAAAAAAAKSLQSSHRSEWPSSKNLQTINAGEDGEKRKSS